MGTCSRHKAKVCFISQQISCSSQKILSLEQHELPIPIPVRSSSLSLISHLHLDILTSASKSPTLFQTHMSKVFPCQSMFTSQ